MHEEMDKALEAQAEQMSQRPAEGDAERGANAAPDVLGLSDDDLDSIDSEGLPNEGNLPLAENQPIFNFVSIFRNRK